MTDESTDDGLTLERYLREVPALDVQQLLAISAAHRGVGRPTLERARAAAGDAARAEGILDELQELHGTIIQWAASRINPGRVYTREGMFDNAQGAHLLYDAREQARPALLDAATALFLQHRLDAADRLALLDPVESVLD